MIQLQAQCSTNPCYIPGSCQPWSPQFVAGSKAQTHSFYLRTAALLPDTDTVLVASPYPCMELEPLIKSLDYVLLLNHSRCTKSNSKLDCLLHHSSIGLLYSIHGSDVDVYLATHCPPDEITETVSTCEFVSCEDVDCDRSNRLESRRREVVHVFDETAEVARGNVCIEFSQVEELEDG